jgi:tripartite-type tricarboxylate transporter receptor subunit TctC
MKPTNAIARALAFGAPLLFILLFLPRASLAQGYPDHPVKIIVPFAPAGPTDVAARLIAQKLSENLRQQFFIENQGGAGGNLGMGNAAKAAPDGYTVLFVSSSYVVNPSLYAKVPYDAYKDFAPVTVAGDAPNLLSVHPSVPAQNVKELVDLIKAGKYNNVAHAGVGTTPHLSGELFRLTFGLDFAAVPFPGAGPAIQSAVGGHTPIIFSSLPPAVPMIKDGKLRALAVSSSKRAAVLPEVPTFAEAGLADQEADTFQAVLVPAGTPKEIVALLHREIVKAVASPEVKERFATLGFEVVANTPEQFAAQIKAEIPKWGKVIKAANIRVE